MPHVNGLDVSIRRLATSAVTAAMASPAVSLSLPRPVALCVALLVVRGGGVGRFVANYLLQTVRII